MLQYVTINFRYYNSLKDVSKGNNFLINLTIILVYLLGVLFFFENMYEFHPLLVFGIGILLFVILIRFGLMTWKSNMITNEYRVEMACITGIKALQMNHLGKLLIIIQVNLGSFEENRHFYGIITDNYCIYSLFQTNIWYSDNPHHNEIISNTGKIEMKDFLKILVGERIKVWIHPDRPHLLLLD